MTMKKKILFVSLFLAAVFTVLPIMNINAAALSTPLVESLPTVSGISYGEPAGNATVDGGLVVDAFSGEALEGKWEIIDSDVIPQNNDTIRVSFNVSSDEYSDVVLDLPVQVEEVVPTYFQSIVVERSGDDENVLNIYTELILTNPTSSEIVEQEDSDVKIWYRLSENDEWAEVTKGEFEISNDMENSQIYLKYEYVGKDGCYLPLTAESEIIPADYIHEREYPNAGAHWIFLGIVVGIIWIAGYVITPLIMICAIVFVLILLSLGGISTVLLTAGIVTLVIVLIVEKRKKSNKV